MRFVELSHTIEPGMKTYPGLPEPRAEILIDHESSRARYQEKSEFLIASLHVCGNTGTYVDSPLHRYRNAVDLAGLPLERLAHLRTVVVEAPGGLERGITAAAFRGVDVRDSAVLVRTDWSKHWRTPKYFESNPYLTLEACEYLAGEGARFVGIDSLNIDDIEDLARPAHTVLLGAGIPVCEHLTNLAAAPRSGGWLHAVPIAWKGGATFPVRAYLIVE
jgi:kynurenine formamidase